MISAREGNNNINNKPNSNLLLSSIQSDTLMQTYCHKTSFIVSCLKNVFQILHSKWVWVNKDCRRETVIKCFIIKYKKDENARKIVKKNKVLLLSKLKSVLK